jgi:hypothetical protein
MISTLAFAKDRPTIGLVLSGGETIVTMILTAAIGLRIVISAMISWVSIDR